MRTRTTAALVVAALLAAGCSDARDAASTVTDCAGLASDVARSGLAQTPTRAEAEAAARRLDERVESLESDQVRAAATTLRDRLRDLEAAARSADPVAAARARQAAQRTAEVCGLPAEQFLG